MAYTKRDSKDPQPAVGNIYRQNEDGNTPVTGEKHDSAKAEHVGADVNRSSSDFGVKQPTRQNADGNTSVTGEAHDQAKASSIPASRRF